jgi:hypothetical protein
MGPMAQNTSLTKAKAGRAGALSKVLLLMSVRKPELRQRGNLFITAMVLQLAGVGLLAWIGYIHWVLWQVERYKVIRIDGPFFLVDAIAGVVLAAVLLVWPRPLVGLVSAGFVAGTILALVISLTVGLFGFNELISANYVVLALVVESITVLILLAWIVVAVSAVPGRSSASAPGRPAGQTRHSSA